METTVQSEISGIAFITPYHLLTELFDKGRPGQVAITLYMFYQKQVPIQGTTRLYATNSFCIKGLRWDKDKFYAAKKMLKDTGFVRDEQDKDGKGRILKTYVVLCARLRKVEVEEVQATGFSGVWEKPEGGKNQTPEKTDANACSSPKGEGKENACSPSEENPLPPKGEVEDVLEFFNATCGTRYRMTKENRRMIANRLKTFSAAELRAAIRKRFEIPFYRGENPSKREWAKDFLSLFRSDEKVDAILNHSSKGSKKAYSGQVRWIAADGTERMVTEEQIDQLRRSGRRIEYDAQREAYLSIA